MELLKTAWTKSAGKKTYVVAACMALYALLGYLLGKQEAEDATRLLFEAAAFAGLRAAKPQA